MATWLYQMNQRLWDPQRYRTEIWEGERWAWPVGMKFGAGKTPEPGDTIVFFYAPTGGRDAGFYGWSVVLEWLEDAGSQLRFRPVAPSDHLKMHPWWDDSAAELADKIRGRVKQGTMWPVQEDIERQLRAGITKWVAGLGEGGGSRGLRTRARKNA